MSTLNTPGHLELMTFSLRTADTNQLHTILQPFIFGTFPKATSIEQSINSPFKESSLESNDTNGLSITRPSSTNLNVNLIMGSTSRQSRNPNNPMLTRAPQHNNQFHNSVLLELLCKNPFLYSVPTPFRKPTPWTQIVWRSRLDFTHWTSYQMPFIKTVIFRYI